MRKNIVSIQFLRFVAAALVVLVHASHAINKYYFVGSLPKSFMHLADFGASGVHIFFVISGFVMVFTSFRDRNDTFSPSDFAAKRLIRIYPIYFVYAAAYLLFYWLFANGKNLTVGQLIGSIFLLPGYSAYIIGPGWTLAYEIYFYTCFSIFMVLGLTRGISALTLFFFLAIMSQFFIDTSQPTIHVLTNSLLVEFLVGAFLGYVFVTSIPVSTRLSNLILAAGLVGFLAGILFGYGHFPQVITWGAPSALVVAGVVFRERNGVVPAVISKYAFMGDSSYSLYLLHVVLIDAALVLTVYLSGFLNVDFSRIGTFWMISFCIVLAPYSVIVAYYCYEGIEKRILSALRQTYRQRKKTVPAHEQTVAKHS